MQIYRFTVFLYLLTTNNIKEAEDCFIMSQILDGSYVVSLPITIRQHSLKKVLSLILRICLTGQLKIYSLTLFDG